MRRGSVAVLALAAACKGQVHGPAGGPDGGGDGAPPVSCGPSGGGPYWLQEGETVEVSLACTTGLELGGGAFTIAPLPDGAVYDPALAKLTWTPALDQAAVYDLTIDVPDLGEQAPLRIGVADAWDAPDNTPVVDPTAYPYEYGLPVLFLSPTPTWEEPYMPVTVVYRGHPIAAQGKLHGASSLSYPKQSYIVDFPDQRFSDLDADGGFTGRERIVLTSTFDDNSYLRQRLAYELWSRLAPTVPVQAYNVVVYLDGQYWGLYELSDHIDGDLMKRRGLDRNGNLYKAISHDANFLTTDSSGNAKTTLHQGYEKKEGTPVDGQAGAYDDLDALVSFVATADDPTFHAQIGQKIEVDDYIKWWILATYAEADDTAGKNSYHYHDAVTTWRVAPWDFNASFGQTWTTTREGAGSVADYFGNNNLFARLAADATYGPEMKQLYQAALAPGGALHLEDVEALIDGWEAEIHQSAERDWARWQDAYRSFARWSDRTDWTSHDEEVQYLEDWLSARVPAVESALVQ